MSGTSAARIRQILILICLLCTLLCSLIVMGLVSVNGKITFDRYLNNVCLLYVTMDGDVVVYNNGFCLFPIIAAAITAGFSLMFLIFLCMVLHRKDEFSPTGLSLSVVFFSGLLALLSFAMCGEIGLGLNKACTLLEDSIDSCRSNKNFSSLYGALITAGIMAGFWVLIMFLEVFQLLGRPVLTTNTLDTAGQTTVVPSTKRSKSSHGISNSNITDPNYVPPSTSSAYMTSAAPTSAPGPANVYQDGTYQQQQQQPEMTSYQMNDNNNGYDQAQQRYYQATPQPQYQQGQPTPQMQYQQVQGDQKTPQMAYQQAYQPQQAYLPPPFPQSAQPLQLQQPCPTYPAPASDPYPPQTVAVDTFPSSSGAGSNSAL
ncbi:hypothetical protein KI688_000297 [Linnemannia hyalina]|uniref:Uncharacterized protein n=1 Tax=Linnemannia hyalina TaxID=64524 RepID=A0A9P7Y6P1_9FUNG|nr:hypothetical protein KI688_000297 [Linnemannia hyalina]